jgi:hypothetical protein
VRAALAVREAIGELNAADPTLGLRVRIGVTTGEAMIALSARPSEGEGMAAGDIVNTCSRLQSAAPVDGILVDETSYRATSTAIEYRDAEPVAAKGKSEPIRVWEVVAPPRTRLGVDIAFRGGAELIGREQELRLLRDALARSERERAPQLVTLAELSRRSLGVDPDQGIPPPGVGAPSRRNGTRRSEGRRPPFGQPPTAASGLGCPLRSATSDRASLLPSAPGERHPSCCNHLREARTTSGTNHPSEGRSRTGRRG